MKILHRILYFFLFLVIISIGFVLFFRLDFILDQPVGIISNMIFPGSGIWRVYDRDGESRIFSQKLQGPVHVIIDDWGVPHIYAGSDIDISFVMGYLHSRDRFFQMDMARRQARGLLSEMVGSRALNSDKFHLAVGMQYWAEKTIEEMQNSESDKELLDLLTSYADGVNHYLDANRNNVSLEYVILGVDPLRRRWSSLDSMVFSKIMARMLSWSYRDIYNTGRLNALGRYLYEDELSERYFQIPIIDGYGDWKDFSTENGTEAADDIVYHFAGSFLRAVEQIPSEIPLLGKSKGLVFGSNNWAVSGKLTASGYPILCNDMHLMTDLPNIWYETHLVNQSEGHNIYGYTFAGVPFPIAGFNDDIAWGFTNTGFDVIDWYYYNEIDEDKYIFKGQDKEYTIHKYNIPVRNSGNYILKVRNTVDGPVLSDHLNLSIPIESDDNLVIAPRWTANAVTYELKAIYGFGRSRNIEEFNYYSKYFYNPGQNIIFADKQNIALRPTGLVPIRSSGSGEFLYNGSEGEGRWEGYVPFDALPYEKNPGKGYLMSANQITAGPDYEYCLQTSWDESYRPRRIDQLLRQRDRLPFTTDYMAEIQHDVYSIPAESFMPYLLDVLLCADSDEIPETDEILKILSGWDFHMSEDSPAASIYKTWEHFYRANTFGDEFEKHGISGLPMLGFLEFITKYDENSPWFNNINTEGVKEKRDDMILQSIIDAIGFMNDFYDTEDPGEWTWGRLHSKLFGHISFLPGFSRGPFPASGDGLTVNPSPAAISKNPVPSRWGASQRLIVDLSEPNNSLSCIPGGQSGRVNSKNYSDQLEDLYLQSEYHNVNFYSSADEFPEGNVKETLIFLPEGKNNKISPMFSHILFLIPACLFFVLYLNYHQERILQIIILSVLLLISVVYLNYILEIPLWKALMPAIIIFSLMLRSKTAIFFFSISATLIIWLSYILYSFHLHNTYHNLQLFFMAVNVNAGGPAAVGMILVMGVYCGILCGLLSIVLKRVFQRSFLS